MGTPRNGKPRTSSAISVPLSANISVNACATGFTLPCGLPPSQITASEIPRGWILDRLYMLSSSLNRSPVCSSCAIFSKSIFSGMILSLRSNVVGQVIGVFGRSARGLPKGCTGSVVTAAPATLLMVVRQAIIPFIGVGINDYRRHVRLVREPVGVGVKVGPTGCRKARTRGFNLSRRAERYAGCIQPCARKGKRMRRCH